ncbi:hypothetical protein [Hydrogenophaga sp.]|uniref:hypothetical protein n=1 Tax=Hydrogenophaga sp. TaxID=1904254 RepID=UPI003F6EE43B
MTLQQLTILCNEIERKARDSTSRSALRALADELSPVELRETISRFPPLAAKASLVVLALPPEKQMEILRDLLPPSTLSGAAAKPDAFTIATMARAIVEGGSSDRELQARLANHLMTEEACMTLAAEATVPQLANAARAVSLQPDAATKARLLQTLLIPARPAPKPTDAVSNAYLVEGALLTQNLEHRSDLVERYLSDETCVEVADRGGHVEIGSMAFAASFIRDPERLNEVADRLFSDRALDTLVNAATSGLHGGHEAIGRAAKLVDALPDGQLQTELADRIATPEVCKSLETSADPRAIGRMAMAAMSVSNVGQLTQAMGSLASRAACESLVARPEPVALGQVLYATAYWNKQDGKKGLTAADMLLQGAPLEALCNWPEPRDVMNALPAATMLPDTERKQSTLAKLLNPETIAAVSKSQGDLIAWAAFYLPHMKDGTDRDTVLRELLTPSNGEKVLAYGAEEIKAFKDAAALLPEGTQRQQVLAIMNGEPVPQWRRALMAERDPSRASHAPRSAGGPSL